jgi:hypothetical protein
MWSGSATFMRTNCSQVIFATSIVVCARQGANGTDASSSRTAYGVRSSSLASFACDMRPSVLTDRHRLTDPTGRQSVNDVGIIGRRLLDFAAHDRPAQRALPADQPLDNSRIGLQPHVLLQAVDEHRGDALAFVAAAGFLFRRPPMQTPPLICGFEPVCAETQPVSPSSVPKFRILKIHRAETRLRIPGVSHEIFDILARDRAPGRNLLKCRRFPECRGIAAKDPGGLSRLGVQPRRRG